jgi:hypothetical protein
MIDFRSYLTEAFNRPAPWAERVKPVSWGRVGKYADMMQNNYFAVCLNDGLDSQIGGERDGSRTKYHSGYGIPVRSGKQMNKWVEEKVLPKMDDGSLHLLRQIQAHIFRVSFGHSFIWGMNRGTEIRELVTSGGKRIYELAFSRLYFPVHLQKIDEDYYWSDESMGEWNTSNNFTDNDMGDLNPRQTISVFGTVIEIAKQFTARSDFGGLLFGRKQEAKSARGRIYGGLAQRVGASIGLKSYDFPQGDRHFEEMGGPSADTVLVVKNKNIYDECVVIANEASEAQRERNEYLLRRYKNE